MRIILRSILFHLVFYAVNLIQMAFWTPVFFLIPRKLGWRIVRFWATSLLWVHRWTVGARFEFRGLENVEAAGGRFIVASKHQSAWETYAIIPFLDDPSYVLKRELMWVPLFGWYMAKAGLVPVDRGARSRALASMAKAAARQYEEGRKIVIYPEGTRKAPGDSPAYKFGVTYLYRELNATVLPVAVNSGLFWPRRSALLYPGLIVMEFLPPIEPGLKPEEFSELLQERIESAANRLLAEASGEGGA